MPFLPISSLLASSTFPTNESWWTLSRWAAHSQHSLESRRTSSCLHVAAMHHSVTHSQENQEPLLPFPSTNSTDLWGEIKSHPTRSCLVILAVFFKSPSFNLSSPFHFFELLVYPRLASQIPCCTASARPILLLLQAVGFAILCKKHLILLHQ